MTTPRSDSKPLVTGTATPELKTAVLLTSGRVFSEHSITPRSGRATQPEGALSQVGGVSLFQRAVLTLQRAGITRLLILADQQEEALRWCLSKDSRITAQIRWLPVREFPPQDIKTWEALAGDIQGSYLVLSGRAVFSQGLIEQLRREIREGRSFLAVTHPSDTPTHSPVFADMLVVPANVFSGSAASDSPATQDESPFRALVSQALAGGRLRTVAAEPGTSCWYQAIRNADDVGKAEELLFRSLKSDLDGFVDTYFNRKVSVALTRLFLTVGWSPNTVTSLSILIGLTAALSFSLNTYVAGVIGALLFQLSAIVDCCDGDVARLTLKESRFGAQLDLLGDNAVHMAIFAGIAWTGYTDTHSFVPLGLAATAIVGSALSLWFVTHLKERKMGNPARHAEPSRSDIIVRTVANRDFSVVVLLFALFNGLGVFLWLAAIGSNLFWLYTAWVTRRPTARA
jgi:phosphatidylglycerophosphate synthase